MIYILVGGRKLLYFKVEQVIHELELIFSVWCKIRVLKFSMHMITDKFHHLR